MRQFVLLCRPHQWLKNGFVWLGLVFGHHWAIGTVWSVALAFGAFCLGASAVYIHNDMRDVDADRLHPLKRFRPLASGTVSRRAAAVLCVVLLLLALGMAWTSSRLNALLLVVYVALNVAYTLKLKYWVIIDVFSIAAGFLLRVLAGTFGVGIHPSSWLLLCTLMVTLFLGFAKRRAEIDPEAQGHPAVRAVLGAYTAQLLEQLTAITATGTIICYALYTVSVDTIAVHGSSAMVYTVPLVTYGIFRYLYLLHTQNSLCQDTARALLDDRPLQLVTGAWIVATLVILA